MPRKPGSTIWLSLPVKEALQARKLPGQSFEGVIIQLLNAVGKETPDGRRNL